MTAGPPPLAAQAQPGADPGPAPIPFSQDVWGLALG